jgi:hypothetical protein
VIDVVHEALSAWINCDGFHFAQPVTEQPGTLLRTVLNGALKLVKPTQICGKLLTSALSRFYIHESHGERPVEMAENVLFIQIVDMSRLV